MAIAFGPQDRPWKWRAVAILSFPTANSKKRTRHSLTPLIHEKEALTQAEAAIPFQVTQPRISDLMRGEISRFSLDTLVNMLIGAGMELDMRIRTKPRRAAACCKLDRVMSFFGSRSRSTCVRLGTGVPVRWPLSGGGVHARDGNTYPVAERREQANQ